MSKPKPNTLQEWMKGANLSDEDVAEKLTISRVQVSRIRRGESGASKKTAIQLEKLTGIPWPKFIEPERVT